MSTNGKARVINSLRGCTVEDLLEFFEAIPSAIDEEDSATGKEGKATVIESIRRCTVGDALRVFAPPPSATDKGDSSAVTFVSSLWQHQHQSHSRSTRVQVTSDDMLPETENVKYSLGNGPGCVLVMSNSFWNIEGKKRVQASKKDLEMMSKLWKKVRNCEFFNESIDADKKVFSAPTDNQTGGNGVYSDLHAAQMKLLIEKLARTKEQYSYVVVYISSHGGRVPKKWVEMCESDSGKTQTKEKLYEKLEEMLKQTPQGQLVQVFFGNDSRPVREDEIINLFHNHVNEKLRGIPKFFILDYCRSAEKSRQKEKPKAVRESQDTTDDNISSSSLPIMSDIVVLNATHDHYYAFDHKEGEGSMLTKALYNVFMENIQKKEALEMLTMINSRMKEKCSDGKAMSAFQSSLDKKLYFCHHTNEGPETDYDVSDK